MSLAVKLGAARRPARRGARSTRARSSCRRRSSTTPRWRPCRTWVCARPGSRPPTRSPAGRGVCARPSSASAARPPPPCATARRSSCSATALAPVGARRGPRAAAARRRRRAPRPDPARPAQPRLARRRDGAVLERPPLRLPRRLRRLGGAPVPRLRDGARPLGARAAREAPAGRGGAAGRRAAPPDPRAAGPADLEEALRHYRVSAERGLLKILSKMGISLLASYHGAQLFEAVGLGSDLIELGFAGTPSRIGGLSVEELAQETVWIHQQAFPELTAEKLQDYGFVRYRPARRVPPQQPGGGQDAAPRLRRGAARPVPRATARSSRSGRRRCCATCCGCAARPGAGGRRELPAQRAGGRRRAGLGHPPALLHRRHVARARSRARRTRPSPSPWIASTAGRTPGEGGEDAERDAAIDDVDEAGRSPRFPHLQGLENGDRAASQIRQVASGRFGVTTGVSRRRRAARDQGRPGRQARRGRRAARRQGHRRTSPGCAAPLRASR